MPKKINFVEEAPEELTQEQESYVPATQSSFSLINPKAAIDLDIGEARPPFLKLIHGTTKNAGAFNPGDLVLQNEYLVCPKGKSIDVVILNIDQGLRERVSDDDFNSGTRPRMFKNVAAAKAAGLSTEWVNGVGPDASPAMDMIVLLRKPEHVVCGLFGIDIGDKHEYAIARMMSDKTAYKYMINDIGLIIKTKLAKSGMYSGVWQFYTEMSKPNMNKRQVQVIRAKFKEMLSPEVIRGIESVIGTPANG